MSGVTKSAIAVAIHDLRSAAKALAVVVVDYEGATVAISGEANAFPVSLKIGLSGRALQEAGSLMKLLEHLLSRLPPSERFYNVQAVAETHLLAIAYDDDADPELPVHARRARVTIEEIVRASRS